MKVRSYIFLVEDVNIVFIYEILRILPFFYFSLSLFYIDDYSSFLNGDSFFSGEIYEVNMDNSNDNTGSSSTGNSSGGDSGPNPNPQGGGNEKAAEAAASSSANQQGNSQNESSNPNGEGSSSETDRGSNPNGEEPSDNPEGLEEMRRWRARATRCEHRSWECSTVVGTEDNINTPIPCDYGDGNHNAIDGPFQEARLCGNCHAVICSDCHAPNSVSDEDSALGDEDLGDE